MKKTFLSVLISLVMILTLIPTSAFADPVTEVETEVTVENPEGEVTDSSDEGIEDSSETPADETTEAPEDAVVDPNAVDPNAVDPNAVPLPEDVLATLGTRVEITAGYYNVVSSVDEDYYLEVANGADENFANIQVGKKTNDGNQIFEFQKFTDKNTGLAIYKVIPYCAQSRCLDIYAGKTDNFTNVDIYKANGTMPQRFYFTEGSVAGNYVIHSNLSTEERDIVLDMKGGQAYQGNNVSIYAANGSKAQEWILKPATLPEKVTEGIYQLHSQVSSTKVASLAGGDKSYKINVGMRNNKNIYYQMFSIEEVNGSGYYKIRNANYSSVLCVQDGKAEDGANVWSYSWNGTRDELWQFYDTGDTDGSGNKIYKIKSRLGNLYLANVSSNIKIMEDDDSNAVKWTLTSASLPNPTVNEGCYTICCKGSEDKVMDIYGSSVELKGQVQIYKRNNSSAQKFNVKKTSDGYYTLQPINSGYYVNLAKAEVANRTTIWQYKNDGSNAVKWKLVDTGDGDGSFYIMYYNTEYCLDVAAGVFDNFTKIQLYKNNKTVAQKFYFRATCPSTGWQNYMGKYRYVYDADGNYYVNTTTPDGYKVGPDGTRIEQWVVKDGYYRYQLSDGTLVNDVRPYLTKLFGGKIYATCFGTYAGPNISAGNYKATVDRTRCLVTVYTKYPGTSGYNLPVCAFKCSPGKDGTATDAGNWTTCQLAGTWSILMGPSYGQYALRIHDGELFHSVACPRQNRNNVDPGTYNALGTKQSHGCVRLDVRNAYWLYYFCGVGMPVYVGDNLANPIANVPQPKMAGSANTDPTDPYYTGNKGYEDTNVYYGNYYF